MMGRRRTSLGIGRWVYGVVVGGLLLPGAAAAQGPTDSLATARQEQVAAVMRAIAGREQLPAESVFRDIQVLRGVPAGRVPAIMNFGFGRSLGVGCGHCHVVGEWARNDSTTKAIAREMFRMVGRVNGEMLPAIAGLAGRTPTVNCTTCHRGQRKPALNLP